MLGRVHLGKAARFGEPSFVVRSGGRAFSDPVACGRLLTLVDHPVPRSSIPEQIEVSVEDARIGTQFHAGDLKLPANTELRGDPELLVANVVAATEADAGEEPEAAETDTEAADEAAAETAADEEE